MKKLIIIILLTAPITGFSQIIEVGYSARSVKIWGQMPATKRFNISYIHHIYSKNKFSLNSGARFNFINSKSYLMDNRHIGVHGKFYGLFVIPAAINYDLNNGFELIGRYGFGIFNDSFPNIDGKHFNFLLETGIAYRMTTHLSLSMRYSHISNCYRGVINPGLDNITSALIINF